MYRKLGYERQQALIYRPQAIFIEPCVALIADNRRIGEDVTAAFC